MLRRVLWSVLLLAACTPPAAAPTVSPPAVVVQVATFTPPPTATRTVPPPTATATPTSVATFTPVPTATATPTPWPTPDAESGRRQIRLPILMYHYVEPWPADAGAIRQGLTVPPEAFAAQLAYLAQQGYQTVSLYDLIDALALGRPLPERAVVMTFDDGYRTLPDYAVPEMQKYGYTGTVFVITELMDKGLDAYLTWPQAEALAAAGWSIESHTKTHSELPGTSRDFQLYEILGSAQTIEAHTGHFPRFLCYPAGKYDATSLEVVRQLDLWGAVTVNFSRVHTLADQFTWGRVRVDGRGTLQDFINALTGP